MTVIIRRSPSRALTVVEPFYRPMSLLNEVERMAREMWELWEPFTFPTGFAPKMDMIEDKDTLVIKAEFPSVKQEDLNITLEGDMLTIKAEKKQEEVSEEANYHTSERYFGHYYRSITLPFPVDAEKLSATFENGLLKIRLPKAEEAKPKHIEVKVGSPRLRKPKGKTSKSK